MLAARLPLANSLAAAEKALMDRQIDLQLFYVPDLSTCRRVLTVDPTGAIVPSKPQHPVVEDLWLARR
jgi:hypothetical protein